LPRWRHEAGSRGIREDLIKRENPTLTA
jgi:hypothetical protein